MLRGHLEQGHLLCLLLQIVLQMAHTLKRQAPQLHAQQVVVPLGQVIGAHTAVLCKQHHVSNKTPHYTPNILDIFLSKYLISKLVVRLDIFTRFSSSSTNQTTILNSTDNGWLRPPAAQVTLSQHTRLLKQARQAKRCNEHSSENKYPPPSHHGESNAIFERQGEVTRGAAQTATPQQSNTHKNNKHFITTTRNTLPNETHS